MFPVSFQSRAVGVPHDPDAVSPVGGSDIRGAYAAPFNSHPHRGQVPEYSLHSSSKESWDVLHDDVPRS
jgi:hypothetical protein